MGDFNRDRSRGGFSRGGFGGRDRSRGGFGGGRGGFGGRDRSRGEKEMFDAICAECGQACKIPFIPKTDKPVYCSSCFEKTDRREPGDRDFGERGSNNRNSSPRKSDNMSEEKLDLLISKMDRILELLKKNQPEEASFEKPAKVKEIKIEKKVEKEEKKTKEKKEKEEKKKTTKKVSKKSAKK